MPRPKMLSEDLRSLGNSPTSIHRKLKKSGARGYKHQVIEKWLEDRGWFAPTVFGPDTDCWITALGQQQHGKTNRWWRRGCKVKLEVNGPVLEFIKRTESGLYPDLER